MVASAVGVGRRFAGWAVAGRCCAGHGCFYWPVRRGTVYGADRRAASRKFHAAPAACPQCRCPGRERCPAPAGRVRAGQRRCGPGAGPCPGRGRLHAGLSGGRVRGRRAGRRRAVCGHRHCRGRRHLHRGAGPDCRAVWGLCRAGHTGDMAADRSARRLRVSGGGS